MLKRHACAGYALLGLLLAAAGQVLTVRYNYGGDPTALFYTGQQTILPSSLGEQLQRAPNAKGFDGQFYHLMAHDPFLTKGYAASVDNPRLRWRRILVPLAAFLLALGRSGWIDGAYFAVIDGFLFLGVYWLARLARDYGLSAAWGLLFLTLPAVFISLERMTVDIALAALATAFALYVRKPDWKLYAVLAAAPLARETGLLFAAGYAAHHLVRRDWRRALWFGGSITPFSVWTLFVHSRAPKDATAWFSSFPFAGLLQRTLRALPYDFRGNWLAAAAVSDYLGILGIWMAVAAVFFLLWKRNNHPLVLPGLGFVVLVAVLGRPDVWEQSYGFARIFSPWFVWLAALGLETNSPWMLAPWASNIPRMAVQTWVHIPGIVSGLRR